MKPLEEERFRQVDEEPGNILRESAVESDCKFWSGERPVSVVQWIGLLLMFIGVIVALAGWVKGEYGAFMALLGALVLFVVLGNRRAPRKAHSPEK